MFGIERQPGVHIHEHSLLTCALKIREGVTMGEERFQIEEVEIDRRQPIDVQKRIVEAEKENASQGRLTGLLILLVGVLLTLAGVTGAVDLKLSGLGLSGNLGNAAPGVVLMVIGLFVIWRTNLRIKQKR
jgi:hypothetical protein